MLNEKVLNHIQNARNTGVIVNPDDVGFRAATAAIASAST